MCSKIKRAIGDALARFAWPNAKLDQLVFLVQAYCYRDLPFSVVLPRNVDGSCCDIRSVAFAPSIERVFVLAGSSEIFVLTEDLVLLGSISPTQFGQIYFYSPVAYDSKRNVLMAIDNNGFLIAIGLDGIRRRDLDWPRRVLSFSVNGDGHVYTLERNDTGEVELFHGETRVCPWTIARLRWSESPLGGVGISSRIDDESDWTVLYYDPTLAKSIFLNTGASEPIGFEPTLKVAIAITETECRAIKAIGLDGRVKFQCPHFYRGLECGRRSLAIASWGSAIRTTLNDRITLDQLRFDPIPPTTRFSRADLSAVH